MTDHVDNFAFGLGLIDLLYLCMPCLRKPGYLWSILAALFWIYSYPKLGNPRRLLLITLPIAIVLNILQDFYAKRISDNNHRLILSTILDDLTSALFSLAIILSNCYALQLNDALEVGYSYFIKKRSLICVAPFIIVILGVGQILLAIPEYSLKVFKSICQFLVLYLVSKYFPTEIDLSNAALKPKATLRLTAYIPLLICASSFSFLAPKLTRWNAAIALQEVMLPGAVARVFRVLAYFFLYKFASIPRLKMFFVFPQLLWLTFFTLYKFVYADWILRFIVNYSVFDFTTVLVQVSGMLLADLLAKDTEHRVTAQALFYIAFGAVSDSLILIAKYIPYKEYLVFVFIAISAICCLLLMRLRV